MTCHYVYQCDRCKKHAPGGENAEIPYGWAQATTANESEDLCGRCLADLVFTPLGTPTEAAGQVSEKGLG